MAPGDTDATIVGSPITEAKIAAALDSAVAATSSNCTLSVTSFNQGRSILVSAIEQ